MSIALFLFSLSQSECETHGVHVQFGNVERDLAEAYYDSGKDSGSHYIVLTGSFLPQVDGYYTFTVTCEVYGTSIFEAAVAHLEWDEENVKSGKDTWTWGTNLQKDFRYPFKCTTDDNFYYATLRLQVTLPDGEFFTVDSDYSDTCTVLGCRNLSLTRDTNCEPPAGKTGGRSVKVVESRKENVLGRGGIVVIGIAVVAVVGVIVVVAVVLRMRRKKALAGLTQELLGGGRENELASLEH
jgi:hypothetical protein